MIFLSTRLETRGLTSRDANLPLPPLVGKPHQPLTSPQSFEGFDQNVAVRSHLDAVSKNGDGDFHQILGVRKVGDCDGDFHQILKVREEEADDDEVVRRGAPGQLYENVTLASEARSDHTKVRTLSQKSIRQTLVMMLTHNTHSITFTFTTRLDYCNCAI